MNDALKEVLNFQREMQRISLEKANEELKKAQIERETAELIRDATKDAVKQAKSLVELPAIDKKLLSD